MARTSWFAARPAPHRSRYTQQGKWPGMLTVFLRHVANYKGMNEVYEECSQGRAPARSTVRAELVLSELLVEIEAAAIVE